MQKITTFLTFKQDAAEAASFYLDVFKGQGEITSTMPGPGGTVMAVNFKLFGQEFSAMNGGEYFSFAQGISLFVKCDTQDEIDAYWNALTANGGQEQPCGWLKDKYGVSWQIVPPVLGKLLTDKNPAKAQSVLQAMLKMKKIDIAALEKAHQNG